MQIKSEDYEKYGDQDKSGDEIIASALSILKDRLRVPGERINSPDAAEKFFILKLGGLEHEVFACLFLDTQNRIIEYEEMFRGTIDGSSVYTREIVKRTLILNAGAIMFAHNHPSGTTDPSVNDRRLTRRLHEAMDLMDIRVLDHIIVGGVDAFSFSRGGVL